MAVSNSLVAQKENKMEVQYLANGEEVKLTPNMVKRYLVSGDASAVTDQEVMMFITLCKYQHLNPFLREAYLIKYGSQPATIVAGKDTFLKRANRNDKYRGKEDGIIIKTKDGKIEYRNGTFHDTDEKIVGGWAKIYLEGREQPEMATVSFEEYVGRKKDGSINSQWASKPATMIRKVAVVQALREAFPEDFGALYSPEEMGEASEVIPEQDTPIEVVAEAKPVEKKSASDALFE